MTANSAPSDKARLRRAWKHLFRHGLLRNKKRALAIFLLGLITSAVQISAVLLIIGAARAYDADGILSAGPVHIDFSTENSPKLLYALAAGGLVILAILMTLWQRIIVTNIGRKFFEEAINDTRQHVINDVKAPRHFSKQRYIHILSRDCRFLSLSYVRILNLVQPAILLIAIFGLALWTVPIAALFLGIAGLVVLPLNIYLTLWAARTSEDISASAKLKSAEDRQFIDRVSQDPFVGERPGTEVMAMDRPGEEKFLSTFVQRQRMGTYSQSITDIMMASVILSLAALLFLGGGNVLLINLTNLVILVILFRFLTGYIASIAQAVTMVSSYEPFFRNLMNLKEGRMARPHRLNRLGGDAIVQPVRAAVFQNRAVDQSNMANLKHAFDIDSETALLTSNFDPSAALIETLIAQGQLDLSAYGEPFESEITEYISQAGSTELSASSKLILILSSAKSHGHGYIFNSDVLDNLGRTVLRSLFQSAGDAPIIIVYKSAPRNLNLPPRFQLFSRTEKGLEFIGSPTEYQNLRDKIIEVLRSAPKLRDELDDLTELLEN